MPLRITRSVDSILYGGENLNPNNLEGSFEHRLWVKKVKDHRGHQTAVVNVTSKDGVVEHLMTAGDGGIWLKDDVNVSMVGIQKWHLKTKTFCEACGRGDLVPEQMIPQAMLSVNAPKKYNLTRHDAQKRR